MSKSMNDYVDAICEAHAAGTINAMETYQRLGEEIGSESYQIQDGETEEECVERCAQNDYADGATGGAVYQEIYDRLHPEEPLRNTAAKAQAD